MVKVENTALKATDIYDKLYNIKIANQFFMDSVQLILLSYEQMPTCPTQPYSEGMGMLYSFIDDKLSEVIDVFNEYEK